MLTDERRTALTRDYWETDVPAGQLGWRYGLRPEGRRPVIETWRHIDPLLTGDSCSRCSGSLVWHSRQARREDRRACVRCRHQEPEHTCHCDGCLEERKRRALRERELHERRQQFEYDYWRSTLDTEEHARFAWSRLGDDVQRFYAALVGLLDSQDQVSWDEVADVAGVWTSTDWLIGELARVGLVCRDPEGGYKVNTRAGAPDGPLWFEAVEAEEEARQRDEERHWREFELFESGRHSDGEVFTCLAALGPGLHRFATEVPLLGGHGYCDRVAWWGAPGTAVEGVRQRLDAVLAEAKTHDPIFMNDHAFEVAHRHLAALMPACAIHNDHPPVRISDGIARRLNQPL